jgi:hypothetical protein
MKISLVQLTYVLQFRVLLAPSHCPCRPYRTTARPAAVPWKSWARSTGAWGRPPRRLPRRSSARSCVGHNENSRSGGASACSARSCGLLLGSTPTEIGAATARPAAGPCVCGRGRLLLRHRELWLDRRGGRTSRSLREWWGLGCGDGGVGVADAWRHEDGRHRPLHGGPAGWRKRRRRRRQPYE